MCSEQRNLFKKKKKHQHSKRYRNAIIMRNLNILVNSARDFTIMRRKQLQQHYTTVLAELLVRIICAEYTWMTKTESDNIYKNDKKDMNYMTWLKYSWKKLQLLIK